MVKKVGSWGGTLAVRLGVELSEVGIVEGDYVHVEVKGDKVILSKVVSDKRIINGEEV